MSREKLPMSTVSVDQLFILINKQKLANDVKQNKKHSFKATPINIPNQIKQMSIKERNEILTKKTYNNIKAFKHSNRVIHKTMQNLQLNNSIINPQNSNFQNEDQSFNTLPQNYKAFPKRQSPLKNNNPCKFFLATQPKKLHQRMQQNSILEMDSKIYMLVNSSFSNARIKDQTRKIRNLFSERRNKTTTIKSEDSPRIINFQQTISLMKLPKEKLGSISPTLKRPKTTSFRGSNNYSKKDTIQPWENYIQHDHSDNEQIANKN